MNDVISKLQNESDISLGMGKCVMFSMMNTITQALYELSNSAGHNLLNCDDFVERLLKCQNISEMKNVLDDIFHSIEHENTSYSISNKRNYVSCLSNV